jgi:hypothetical protein
MAEPKGREKSKMIEPNQTWIAAKFAPTISSGRAFFLYFCIADNLKLSV